MIRKRKRNGFSMIELLYTLIVLSSILSISIGMDYIYSKDRAKDLNQNIETLDTVAADIKKAFAEDGDPIEVSTAYLTFQHSGTGCYYSYVYYQEDHVLAKTIDPACTYTAVDTRTLYMEDAGYIVFSTLANNIYEVQLNRFNEPLKIPYKFTLHTPKYTLD